MKARLLVVAPLAWVVGCSDPVVVGPPPVRTPPPPPAEVAPAATEADAGPRGYRDEDFVELDAIHRDPFRDFTTSLVTQTPVASAIPVKMRDVSLDQMRLIAVVTGMSVPYAMIADPSGIGHVIVRGDYIGRPEVVNAGGADGLPIALNWKVDRIRTGEVVLSRADPIHPDQPPLMRSLLLRDTNSDAASSLGLVQGVLGNTGAGSATATSDAPSPGAPSPNSPVFAPSPSSNGSSRGLETPPAIAPTPGTGPAAPGETPGTSGGSGSRFGGVFRNRP